MLNEEKINKIRAALKRNCHNCLHYMDSSFDYEGGYHEPAYCTKTTKGNLKSFPFYKEQKCFELSFELLYNLDEDLGNLAYSIANSDTNIEKLEKLKKERYGDILDNLT